MSAISESDPATREANSPLAPVDNSVTHLPFFARLAEAGVTWRSLLVGSLAVAVVCLLTPYNDFVLSDTSLATGFLPLIGIVIQFVLIVGINAPLHRFVPRFALRTRELAVIALMTLLACSLPNWGLMRFLAPMPVSPFYLGSQDDSYWKAFQAMQLPSWLFAVDPAGDGRTDPVQQWFYWRVPSGASIPWLAWIKPMLAWGIFVAAMLATLVAVGRMTMDQWLVNERLPFPLVQVQSALIEAPRAGRALNELLRSPALWIGLGIVFCIHTLNGLGSFWPGALPSISLRYDFSGFFVDPPLAALKPAVKASMLSFIVIGATYFIRSRVALSLWATYLLINLVDVGRGMAGQEGLGPAWQDQHLGACAAFILGTLYIGRHHWMRILRNAVGRGEDGNYRITFWIAIGGLVVMSGWLLVVGVQWWMAMLIVAFILASHVVVARVVAETGIPMFRCGINTHQVYSNIAGTLLGPRDVFFGGVFNVIGSVGSRDSAMVFSQIGLGTTRSAGIDPQRERSLGGVIVWTLLLGFILAGVATLWCQYSYPTPLDREIKPQGNNFGAVYIPKRDIGDQFVAFSGSGRFPEKAHSPLMHMAIGFVVTCGLEIASLRWASWPLLPVGYVVSYGAFIGNVWFSIFLGWLAKVLIIRFGGGKLLQAVKPLFVGIIFGEALAAAVFLVINAVMVWLGYPSQNVKFLL